MVNFNDTIFNAAKRRGYIDTFAIQHTQEWEMTFIGQYVIKYTNRLKDLQYLATACGYDNVYAKVQWTDLTERNLKRFRDIILDKMCSNSARTCFAKINSILNDMKNEVELPCTRFADILKAKKQPSQHVYLTSEELEQLEKYSPINEEEKYVQTLCLISAYCGARHSDALRMTMKNVDITTNSLSYVSQKTHNLATIPVHKNLTRHLQNIDLSNQNMSDVDFNNLIRSICRKIGMTTTTRLFVEGKEQIKQKWEFVASHTFRRTFATLLYQKGADVVSIGRMMGHSNDIEVTIGYIVGYKELQSEVLAFFN